MKTNLKAAVPALLVACVAVLPSARGAAPSQSDNVVTNGNFEKWSGGVPDGWSLEIGATNGADTPTSEVRPIPGPALMLRGTAATMAWYMVSQIIDVQQGGVYRLEFESRTKDIRQEGRQFNNCYVGILHVGNKGKPVDIQHQDVSQDTEGWKKRQLEFTVPPAAAQSKVAIFLSKSGILGVKGVVVTPVRVPSKSPGQADRKELLTNGDFTDWTNALPAGWKAEIGARNGGDAPTSQIQQLPDEGVALQGTATTLAWHSLSQDVALRSGGNYELEFMAASQGVQRQGNQYDNCYVGVMCFDAAGKRLDMALEDLSRQSNWRKHRLRFRVPRNAAKTSVLIFLSKTGKLSVKNLSLKEVAARRPF